MSAARPPVDARDPAAVEAERKRRQRSRSIAIAVVLIALVVVFYVVTILQMGASIEDAS